MVKIVDVARHAGVSTATVSRVLNKNHKVAEDLRDRVERAVAELGYSLNVSARSLRTRQTSKILVMVPDISNPFFGNVIRGAEEAAREAGFSVMLGDTGGDEALENLYATMLRRKEVDGLILLGARIPTAVRELLDGKGAAVVHGCEYSPDLGVPSVHIDNRAAGADAVRHLVDLGHRRIGVITGPMASPLSHDRLAGARQAADASEADLAIRHGDYSIESGFRMAGELLAEGITAMFLFSDEMALGALRAVAEAGLRCPDDIAVSGFDDIRFAAFATPPLTTIRQPAHEIGRKTVDLLLARLRGGNGNRESITLPHELVVRASTTALRA